MYKDKAKQNAWARAHRAKHPDKVRIQRRNSHEKNRLKYKAKQYGCTIEMLQSMYVQQGGKCAICGVDEGALDSRLSIDHDHKTNKVRGLLCGNCNRSLGLMKDDPMLLKAAAAYLESTRGNI